MNLASLREWVRQIYATRDDELDCDEVFEILPKYVDTEVAGGDPDLRFPKVKHHLTQCARCRDLYKGVRDGALLEEEAYATSPSVTN